MRSPGDVGFYAYAFDTIAYAITCRGPGLANWEKALRGIHAAGGTSAGVPFRMMTKAGQVVEQVVLVTDGGENTQPFFDQEYERYAQQFSIRPHVVVVRVPGDPDALSDRLRARGIAHDVLAVDASSDYYSQPTLLTLLSQPSRADLLVEVMSTRLPTLGDLTTAA